MGSRRRLVVLAVLGVLAGSAGASPESDKLFREGRELLKAGRVAEACDAFAGSQKLDAKVGTLLNLADCREKQGQTATAWSLFLEARQLAAAQHDARAAEADRRASVIQAKLSYLTITVARARQVEGLVVKRNGLPVDRAQWNTPIALDPGDHVIEASAPGWKPWSTTRTLGARQKLDVVVEALVAEPPAPEPAAGPRPEIATRPEPARPTEALAQPVVPARPVLPTPPVRPLSVGFALGASGDQDTLVGGRVTGGTAVPQGAVRVIGSLLYSKIEGTQLYALGVSADYVWMPLPQVAFAAGLGLGTDHLNGLLGPDGSNGWWTLRASPVIVRLLEGHVEAGLHLQYVRTSDRGVMLGLAAIDLFPL
ncbi:MAG TPA: hypothetical protein VGD37_03745 [Kofleriaceae bacterium]|jgi:hypothetical protein